MLTLRYSYYSIVSVSYATPEFKHSTLAVDENMSDLQSRTWSDGIGHVAGNVFEARGKPRFSDAHSELGGAESSKLHSRPKFSGEIAPSDQRLNAPAAKPRSRKLNEPATMASEQAIVKARKLINARYAANLQLKAVQLPDPAALDAPLLWQPKRPRYDETTHAASDFSPLSLLAEVALQQMYKKRKAK